MLLAQTIGVGKRLINGEWVDAALGPESFRLHIELNQQVFNDISLGGIKTWVSQILKSAEFCLRHFPHILPPSFTPPFSILAFLSRENRHPLCLMFYHYVFFFNAQLFRIDQKQAMSSQVGFNDACCLLSSVLDVLREGE